MDDCLQHNCGIITTQELSETYMARKNNTINVPITYSVDKLAIELMGLKLRTHIEARWLEESINHRFDAIERKYITIPKITEGVGRMAELIKEMDECRRIVSN